jgi:quercetin dioxygenase-like cupin family protein
MSASEATVMRFSTFVGKSSPGRTTVLVAVFGMLPALLAVAAAHRADNGNPGVSAMSGTVLQASGASRPRPAVHTIASDALPHVAGKRITTMVVEFPPAGISPPHHHGGSVTVYVLSGVIRSQLQGQPPIVYKAGDSFFEPPGVVHLLAENVSATEPARVLAVFVADEGATLTTYHE